MAESLSRLVGGLDMINARINGFNPDGTDGTDGTELHTNASETSARRGRGRLSPEQLRRMPILLSRVPSYRRSSLDRIDMSSAPLRDDESR